MKRKACEEGGEAGDQESEKATGKLRYTKY
jgi:hypothetical protein